MIGVSILGGSGFGAGELLRLLLDHPEASVVSAVSRGGGAVADAHTHLAGFYNVDFARDVDFDELAAHDHQVIFSALPNGTSGKAIEEMAARCEERGVKIIDLSGDFRLIRPSHYYPNAPSEPAMRERFRYGLPELLRFSSPCRGEGLGVGVSGSSFIANPGCLATACILALVPIADKLKSVVLDVKTGSSGSGREPKPTTLHANRSNNSFNYKALEHQHEPEILQAIGRPDLLCSFVAHSLPLVRGVIATAHFECDEPITREYKSWCETEPFLRYREGSPEIQDVVATNFCDISVHQRGSQCVATTAIDNLVKGMAGQAIQNMNLMCGLPETTGLWRPSPRPI